MGVTAASGMGVQGMPPGAQYVMQTMKMQVDTVREMGDQAVNLIRSSAIIDPAIGKNLDVSV